MPLPAHTVVEFGQVDTDPDLSVGFGDHNHARTPVCGLVDLGNDAKILHTLQFLLYQLHERDRYSAGG